MWKLKQKNDKTDFVYAITKDGEFLGCAGWHKADTSTPELGIWTKKLAHGNQYGLEAINALIQYANENLKFEYLLYPVDRRNIASRKIPEANGGIIKAERKVINMRNVVLDIMEYHIERR